MVATKKIAVVFGTSLAAVALGLGLSARPASALSTASLQSHLSQSAFAHGGQGRGHAYGKGHSKHRGQSYNAHRGDNGNRGYDDN